jgi:hypothetical protein
MDFREAKMAANWYMLKVRSGLLKAVVRRLQRHGLDVFVPERKPGNREAAAPHPSLNSAEYVYCRFAPEDKESVTTVPGVVDIVQRVASPPNRNPDSS